MTGERSMGSEGKFFKADAAGDAGGSASKSGVVPKSNVSELLKNWHRRVDSLRNNHGEPQRGARGGLKSVELHPPAITPHGKVS